MNLKRTFPTWLALVPAFALLSGCSAGPGTTGQSGPMGGNEPGGMATYAGDKEFHAAHTLREPGSTQHRGKMIDFPVGDGMAKAYWVPPAEGHDQAVLMVHEWWGLNDNIKETADKLNGEAGYAVLAVDLYEGKVASNSDEAG